MKKILTFTLTVIAAFMINGAQAYAPVIFRYEGLARANNGYPVANTKLNLRITIVEKDVDTRVIYEEIQTVNTNSVGLFNMPIGRGVVQSGSMGSFAAGKGLKFVKIEIVSIGESNGFVTFDCIKCRSNGA